MIIDIKEERTIECSNITVTCFYLFWVLRFLTTLSFIPIFIPWFIFAIRELIFFRIDFKFDQCFEEIFMHELHINIFWMILNWPGLNETIITISSYGTSFTLKLNTALISFLNRLWWITKRVILWAPNFPVLYANFCTN